MRRATGREWRQKVVRRLPVALMEYPFECFLALTGGVLGAALLIGSIRPGSLFETLSTAAVVAYALAAIAGAGTILSGLLPRQKSPIPMAVGLRLLALLLLVYGVAVISFSGWEKGGMAGAFFIGMSALAGFRSMYLRGQAEAVLEEHKEE